MSGYYLTQYVFNVQKLKLSAAEYFVLPLQIHSSLFSTLLCAPKPHELHQVLWLPVFGPWGRGAGRKSKVWRRVRLKYFLEVGASEEAQTNPWEKSHGEASSQHEEVWGTQPALNFSTVSLQSQKKSWARTTQLSPSPIPVPQSHEK